MKNIDERENAYSPEDVGKLFLQRINEGDIEGIVSLYEAKAVLVTKSDNDVAVGHDAIRKFYAKILADNPHFEPGERRPVWRKDNVALTSTRLADGTVTAEVARKQSDGCWLWAIDHPKIG